MSPFPPNCPDSWRRQRHEHINASVLIKCLRDVWEIQKQEATSHVGNQEVLGEDAMCDSGLNVKLT